MKHFTKACAVACVLCLVGCDWGLKDEAKKAVGDRLTDPQSAQFREIVSYRGEVVCGQVNSKNKFGGYVGFANFIYKRGGSGGDVEFDPTPQATNRHCNPLSEAEVVARQAKDAESQAKEAERQVKESAIRFEKAERLEASSAQSRCDKALATQAKYTTLLEDPATDTVGNRKIRNEAAEEADYICNRAKILREGGVAGE